MIDFAGEIVKTVTVAGDISKPTAATNCYNYETLKNKPKINQVELIGNKTFEDLGQEALTNTEILEILRSMKV